MVHVHQLDSAPSQDARAVEFAAAAQHLAEAEIIRGGAGQAATAREKRRLLQKSAALGIVDQLERLVRLAFVVGGEARGLARRDMKRRVLHVQRIENVLLQKFVEALS